MSSGILINIAVVIFLLLSIARGWRIGFIRQIFSGIGFFGGLFLGTLFEPYLINVAHSIESRTLLALIATLGTAFIFLTIGEIVGIYLKNASLHFKILNDFDDILGSLIAILSSLIIIWLTSIVLESISVPGLQQLLDSSSIISYLDNHLPNAPTVLTDLGSIIDPNGFPKVFLNSEPSPNLNLQLPSLASFNSAIQTDQSSVVKIEGTGCGGIVEGSGFVIAKDLIATNAHVIAGVNRIYIYTQKGNYKATPIYFNPNLDFAVLRVNNLNLNPITINSNILSNSTPEAFLGYPQGGPLSVKPAVVMQEIQAIGLNIYGQGNTSRSVYELKADVIPGNSGGPLINQQGQVTGVIFAQSTTYQNVGYALTANQIIKPIEQAEAHPSFQTSNVCAE